MFEAVGVNRQIFGCPLDVGIVELFVPVIKFLHSSDCKLLLLKPVSAFRNKTLRIGECPCIPLLKDATYFLLFDRIIGQIDILYVVYFINCSSP